MDASVERVIGELSVAGLNHWGVVSARRYDRSAKPALRSAALMPGTRSILVFASGGRALWECFLADIRAHPEHLYAEQHPLDAFVRRAIEGASRAWSAAPHRWFYAAAEASVHLDFRTLAVSAGIGSPSRLGLVIHKEYGPWLGLRAACMVPFDLEETGGHADLCGSCDAPCVTSCPGSAFIDGQWDVEACATFHRQSEACSTSCDARSGCPVGDEHRYSDAQARYHYNRAVGRVELAQNVEIEDKKFKGLGPHWADWSG
jgi:epoxyqueuosine reductase